MSYKATGWAYDLPLNGSKKFVLVALADMADEAMSCYPGQERLAQMTGVSTKTVERALKSLEELGLISRMQRHDERGWRKSDRFKLHVDVVALPGFDDVQPDMVPGRQNDQEAASQPDTVSEPTRHSVGAIRTFGSYEPSDEPSDTPVVPTTALALVEAPAATFEDFWAAYPRHEKKPLAAKAFAKACQRADPARIVEAARRYRDDPNRETEYTRHPTTWLNGDGWDDDPQPERGPRGQVARTRDSVGQMWNELAQVGAIR